MHINSLKFRWLISFILTLLLLCAGWYVLVIAQYTNSKQANIAIYQAAQKVIVESTARATEVYITQEVKRRGELALPTIEQEVLRLFVQPIHANVYGDAWIYAPTHAVFDMSSDFPAAFIGKSIGEIFKLRLAEDVRTRPHSFTELVNGVTNARPGTSMYTWQPDKASEFAPWWDRLTHDAGWEIAAWTTAVVFPGTANERVWSIGMSSMLAEVMQVSGAYSRVHNAILLMATSTLCGGLFLVLLWRSDKAWQVAELQRVNHDITQANHAMNEAQRIAGIGTYTTNIKTGVWTSSPMLDDIFGIDDSFHKTIPNWNLMIAPESRQDCLDHYNQVISTDGKFDMDYKIIRPTDGQSRWVSALGEFILEFYCRTPPPSMLRQKWLPQLPGIWCLPGRQRML